MHLPTSSTTQLTGLEQPSPLDIPELLDRIFSYVDPYTIGNCVLMVSRDWHAAGRRYLQQAEHVWSDWLEEDVSLERLLEMLPWMTRLRWLSESGGGVAARDNRKRQWAMLLTGLERATHGLQLAGRRNDLEEIQVYMDLLRLLPLSLVDSLATSQQGLAVGQGARLREFELCGQVYTHRLMLLLPLLPCLTTLKLTILNILVGPLQMWRIFQDCPLLEALCITDASCGLENLPGPWIVTEPNPGNTSHVAKPSLALKSLVLYGMSFKQHTLHHFVVYTPHLTELKVVCAKILDNRSFNFARFNQHIRNQRLRLEYFHFSTFNVPHDGVTSDLCPSPHQHTIGFCDFTLAILKSLRPQVNTITTLELFNRESWHVDRSFIVSPDYPLHEYLCSSPHLLHLRALHCDYPIEYMDLHGRIGNLLAHPDFSFHRSKQHRPMPGLPGIWACRKLRTLHIRIITPEKSLRDEKPYPEMARVAFGYIARVCPELRDLALGNDSGRPISRHPPLDLQLQGGFCLLGRLKHLERIEVGRFSIYSTLTPRNFEWMHEFGRSKEKKVERLEYLEAMWKGLGQWSHILESPEILASTITTNGNHGTDQGHFNWRRVGPKLREELKYLGWPIEVQEFFDELDKPVKDGDVGGEFRCFPALKYSSICCPGGFDMPPKLDYKRFISLSTPQM